MIETGIAKVPWLSYSRIEFLKGGMHNGALAPTLAFTGKPIDPGEAASALSALLSCPMPGDRLIRLSGIFPSSDDNFEILIKALRSRGFKVMVVADSANLASWMDQVDWLTIRTTSPFLMIQPNEVWYSPDKDEWDDISMPMMPNKLTMFYFDRTKDVSATERFFCESKYHWQLL